MSEQLSVIEIDKSEKSRPDVDGQISEVPSIYLFELCASNVDREPFSEVTDAVSARAALEAAGVITSRSHPEES